MHAAKRRLAQPTAASTGPVTMAITQHIVPTAAHDFEAWLRDVGSAAAQFPGHQGLMVLPPKQAVQATAITYIFRFDSYAHLQAWEHSAALAEKVKELQPMLAAAPNKRTVTGLEYWFQLPGNAATVPPPRYKMAAVTILAIYPLSLLVPRGMAPFLSFLPPLVRSLCYSVTLVLLMTYIVMPNATRLFARWLFKKTHS